MRIHGWIVLVSMALATTAFADPPRHAPAHGHRAKHKHHGHKHHGHKHHRHHSHDDHAHDHHAPRRHGGVEVVFDPERGVSIAVGFPDIFFHADHFYRHHGGIWQMSERVDGGWKRAADGAIPAAFRKLPHPVPAKLDEGEDRPRHPKWRGKRR